MSHQIATISKKVSGGEELIVVKKKDFEQFMKWQEEMRDVLTKVRRGRAEYRSKKTIVADSPKRFR
ncbi:MAG: hypothetical protein AAB691_04215 [Patescibacteria group bacterium]